jgi:hypothetical protein
MWIVWPGVLAVPTLSNIHRWARFSSSVEQRGCDLGEHCKVVCAQQGIGKPKHHHFQWSIGLVGFFASWTAHGIWVAPSAK